MPERIYDGDHAEVEVPLPDGKRVTVAKGQSGDFPDEVAKSLDEQGTWKKTKGSGSGSTTTAAGGKE